MDKDLLSKCVIDENKKMCAKVEALIQQYLESNSNAVLFNEHAICGITQYYRIYLDDYGKAHVLTKIEDETYDEFLSDLNLSQLCDLVSLIKTCSIKFYTWVAESSDGGYEDKNTFQRVFKTKEEAYYNMRNAALEKMKWNTEYSDYSGDSEANESIEYKVSFSRNKIVHESYSGIYTYTLIEGN